MIGLMIMTSCDGIDYIISTTSAELQKTSGVGESVEFEGWGRGVSRTQSKRGLKKESEGVSRCIRRERRCITTFVTTILFVRKCTAGRRLISYVKTIVDRYV